MWEIVSKYSDSIILTQDDDYSENTESIIKDVLPWIQRVEWDNFWVIPTRKEAIETALLKAEKNDVVLYMKGTSSMPQCGFSSRIAGVLNFLNISWLDINVLADENIRQGIKDFSDWPTIPQMYVKGEFVGGCDIITDMMLTGELDKLLETNNIKFDKDAADKVREANS